jgi:predicted HAD superfamily Cof-like phosphohydrolase
MSEQKRISDWLTTAGVESPNTPKFPASDKLQLALGLVLEELLEAAESASDEDANKFFDEVIWAATMAKFNIVGRNRTEGDLIELRDACADLRVVMGNLIHFAGIQDQFEKDFNEVMDSNFSKFCETEEEADKSVEAYASGTHPNKMGDVIECYHEKVGEYWIIKRKSDNKVLKSIGFREPNFK